MGDIAAAGRHAPAVTYLRLLRNRPFALLWFGATVSMVGDALTFVSLIWLTTELGGGPAEIGILAASFTAPVIVGGLAAGLLLDRFDRRRLLIADNAVRGLVMLTVPVAAWAGVVTQAQLYVVAAVYGLLYMVSLAGVPSIIPDLVPEEDRSTANAMESLAFAVGGVAGPALAGLLIAVIGAANNLALDAATYLVFVGCLLAIRLPARHEAPAAADGTAMGVGLGPALRFVLRTRSILAITIMFMAFNVGEGMLTVLLPILARDRLGLDAPGYGALVSAFTAGSLLGAFAVGALRWRWPLGRSIAVSQLAAGVAILGLAVGPSFPVALGVLVTVGVFAAPLTIWAQTIRMRLIPEYLRGRVFSLLRTFMMSTPPVGGLTAGGLLAGGLAIGPLVATMAVIIAVPGAAGLVHRALAADETGEAPGSPAIRAERVT